MGLRQHIKNDPVARTIVVPYEGTAYVLQGKPDSRVMGETTLLPMADRTLKAKHWMHAIPGSSFDPAMVVHVMIVTNALQRHVDDANQEDEGKTPETAQYTLVEKNDRGKDVEVQKSVQYWPSRYDELEVAELAHRDNGLFLGLLGAAYTVLGIAKGESVFDEVAAGNSEKPADSSLSSTSGSPLEDTPLTDA